MKRRTINLLTLMSLTLCVASAALWVRSYLKNDVLTWHASRGTFRVSWMTGSLVLFGDNVHHREPRFDAWSGYAWPSINYGQPSEPTYSFLNALGFSYVTGDFVPWDPLTFLSRTPGSAYLTGTVLRQRVVAVPFYAIVFSTGILPLIRARGVVQRMVRQRRGLCTVCGYDLRASPERCPECGAARIGAERASDA
jgi:hypothetical protein